MPSKVGEQAAESFRDKLYNVDPTGKRLKIYPTKPRGRFYKARSYVSVLLLVILFASPFIHINGHQLLLLNILERKFVLFGVPFWPQDFHLVALSGLTLVLFIVLFTAIYGRIWCGWLCPQTIFMEMVFRKIEYWLEGDAPRMRNFDRQALSAAKVMRKLLKHGIFFIISFAIANTFLAYIIGSEQLLTIISDPPGEHIVGLLSIIVFSLVFYGVFARFREQACIIVCPYGRYQSALVDENTIAVTYDFKRGEPRSKITKTDKQAIAAAGAAVEWQDRNDCIDCKQCVKVCPTGIDIRNGIQLECVNCTACIDACDEIMDGIKRPRGLIRYASLNGIRQPNSRVFSKRVYAYTAVLLVLLGSLVYLFSVRSDVESTILRQSGTLFNKLADGSYSNFYTIKVLNKTFDELPVRVQLLTPGGTLHPISELQSVPGQSQAEGRFYVALPASELLGKQTPIRFGVYADGRLLEEVESVFIGP